MCESRWRPSDRCVSFPHYLQGSSGESGVSGKDGLKGEKVGKLQIKFPPWKEKYEAKILYHRVSMWDNVLIRLSNDATPAILNHVTFGN